jgi:hypothetical protein
MPEPVGCKTMWWYYTNSDPCFLDIPASTIESTLARLGDDLICDLCQAMLMDRIKILVVDWSNIKVWCLLAAITSGIYSRIGAANNIKYFYFKQYIHFANRFATSKQHRHIHEPLSLLSLSSRILSRFLFAFHSTSGSYVYTNIYLVTDRHSIHVFSTGFSTFLTPSIQCHIPRPVRFCYTITGSYTRFHLCSIYLYYIYSLHTCGGSCIREPFLYLFGRDYTIQHIACQFKLLSHQCLLRNIQSSYTDLRFFDPPAIQTLTIPPFSSKKTSTNHHGLVLLSDGR